MTPQEWNMQAINREYDEIPVGDFRTKAAYNNTALQGAAWVVVVLMGLLLLGCMCVAAIANS
jgi:hypothetical protein